MVQIRVGDTYLDLYQFDPPKLNFTIEDITDTSARSYFTQTFRLPATSNNSTFFNTAFEINGQDFDVTIKIPAQLMIDGNLFTDGELRLNKVYILRENEKIEYECAFFGSARSFATSVGQGTLFDLDMTDYDHPLSISNIVNSWQAYPEGGDTDGFFNGDIIYPLIDYGNTYNTDGATQEGEIRHGNAAHSKPFTNSSYRLEKERFKPLIRAIAVWDKIFEEAGYTYTSGFLSGDTFRNLYVSAFGNEASIVTENLSNIATSEGIGESTSEEIDLEPIFDPNGNIVGGRYDVPLTGSYNVNFSLQGEAFGTSTSVILYLYKFNGAVDTLLESASGNFTETSPGGGEIIVGLYDSWTGTLTAGEELFIRFTSTAELDYLGTLNVTEAPGEISIGPLLDNKYKQIEFVKDILTKFRLVLSPDKNNSSNFIIEPWVNYIGSGDEFDWTNKVDVSKDIQIEPVFYTQKSNIEFLDKEGGDYYNDLYQNQFEEPFGTLRVFNTNELLDGDRKIETKIIPTPVSQLLGAEEATNGMDNTIIPQLHTREPEDTGIQHISIKGNTRLLFYNGIKETGTVAGRNDTWYTDDEAGTSFTGFTDYPMVSHFNIFPVVPTTIDLNWQREQGYILFGLQDENIGSSVYDAYWSSYINSLYNKWARRVTGYFVLNSQDLVNFSFDDVIFFKDAYYYVEKIEAVPLGERASVKVQLIKLLNR